MPLKPCLDCGTPNPHSRCAACQEIKDNNQQPRIRESAVKRGYDKAWYKIRKDILDRDKWICYRCGKKLIGSDATVDHLIPISKDPTLRLNKNNLAACCRSCNSKKQNKISLRFD